MHLRGTTIIVRLRSEIPRKYLEIFWGGGAGVPKLPWVDLNAARLAAVAPADHDCQSEQDGQDDHDDQDYEDDQDDYDDHDQEVGEVNRF